MGMAMQFRRADANTVVRLRAGGHEAFAAFICPEDEHDRLVPEQLIDLHAREFGCRPLRARLGHHGGQLSGRAMRPFALGAVRWHNLPG